MSDGTKFGEQVWVTRGAFGISHSGGVDGKGMLLRGTAANAPLAVVPAAP
jgi:hypothetical protein